RERHIRQRSPRARCRELCPNPASKRAGVWFQNQIRPQPNSNPAQQVNSGGRPRAGACLVRGDYITTKTSGVAQTPQTQDRPSGISDRLNKRGGQKKKQIIERRRGVRNTDGQCRQKDEAG